MRSERLCVVSRCAGLGKMVHSPVWLSSRLALDLLAIVKSLGLTFLMSAAQGRKDLVSSCFQRILVCHRGRHGQSALTPWCQECEVVAAPTAAESGLGHTLQSPAFSSPPLKDFTALQHSSTSWELCSKCEPLGDISESKHDIAYSLLEATSKRKKI